MHARTQRQATRNKHSTSEPPGQTTLLSATVAYHSTLLKLSWIRAEVVARRQWRRRRVADFIIDLHFESIWNDGRKALTFYFDVQNLKNTFFIFCIDKLDLAQCFK